MLFFYVYSITRLGYCGFDLDIYKMSDSTSVFDFRSNVPNDGSSTSNFGKDSINTKGTDTPSKPESDDIDHKPKPKPKRPGVKHIEHDTIYRSRRNFDDGTRLDKQVRPTVEHIPLEAEVDTTISPAEQAVDKEKDK